MHQPQQTEEELLPTSSDLDFGEHEVMHDLLSVVQELSHARTQDDVCRIVRTAARNLIGADGATFILRDGDRCHYVDENAVSPLWKGQKFPIEMCVSGWVMIHGEATIIEDIFKDERVPIEAYKPTFVKSLAMVPIRRGAPIGAIGNYWAHKYKPTKAEMSLLQALADTTSVALENVKLFEALQNKVTELEQTNRALSRFSWVASHDMKEPLRTIATQIQLLQRRHSSKLEESALNNIQVASDGVRNLHGLIESLVEHAASQRLETNSVVPLRDALNNALRNLQSAIHESGVVITLTDIPNVRGDPALLCRLFQNLLANAIKFRAQDTPLKVHIGCQRMPGEWLFSVSDNGMGIDKAYQEKIFEYFERLHSRDAYPGSGLGLAICRKIVEMHGGRIWVESVEGEGSSFLFTLPAVSEEA